MIPLKAVAKLLGVSNGRITVMCRDKQFPLPVKNRAGTIVWWKDEVLAWKEKAVAAA